ncbi:hypothetical protein FHS15_001951 [Paenibacillus castaneae]|nr:hypothetical protein [Paenibacillus castaneae]
MFAYLFEALIPYIINRTYLVAATAAAKETTATSNDHQQNEQYQDNANIISTNKTAHQTFTS